MVAAWGWIGIAVLAVLAFSLLVGLALAQILGRIGTEVAELLSDEVWASAPLTREAAEPAETEEADILQKRPRPPVHSRRSPSPRS